MANIVIFVPIINIGTCRKMNVKIAILMKYIRNQKRFVYVLLIIIVINLVYVLFAYIQCIQILKLKNVYLVLLDYSLIVIQKNVSVQRIILTLIKMENAYHVTFQTILILKIKFVIHVLKTNFMTLIKRNVNHAL